MGVYCVIHAKLGLSAGKGIFKLKWNRFVGDISFVPQWYRSKLSIGADDVFPFNHTRSSSFVTTSNVDT